MTALTQNPESAKVSLRKKTTTLSRTLGVSRQTVQDAAIWRFLTCSRASQLAVLAEYIQSRVDVSQEGDEQDEHNDGNDSDRNSTSDGYDGDNELS